MLHEGAHSSERKAAMRSKALLITSAIAGIIMSTTLSSIPAHAQLNREAEIVGLRQLCFAGNNKEACVKFGMLLGENKERHGDTRRAHADWFGWWER
jgi:hypothetical protein